MTFFTSNLKDLYNRSNNGDKITISKFIGGSSDSLRFDKYIVTKTDRGFVGEDGVIYTKDDIYDGNCFSIICPGDITAYTKRMFFFIEKIMDDCNRCFKDGYFGCRGTANLYVHHNGSDNSNADSISLSISLQNLEDNIGETSK